MQLSLCREEGKLVLMSFGVFGLFNDSFLIGQQCDDRPVVKTRECYVAGSLSSHPPSMKAGGSNSEVNAYPEASIEAVNYIEAASLLAGAGVDFLFLEMMKVRAGDLYFFSVVFYTYSNFLLPAGH